MPEAFPADKTWAEASIAYFRTLPKLTGSSRQKRRAALIAVFDVVRELLRREPTLADLRVDVLDYAFNTISSDKTLRARKVQVRLRRAFDFVCYCNQTYGTQVNEQAVQEMVDRSSRFVAIERERNEPQQLPSTEELPVGYDAAIIHMPLWRVMDEHYVNERLLGKSHHSIRLHHISIRKLGRYLGREAVVGDLNQKTISDYLRYQLEETTLARATVEKDRVQLLAVWRFCARKRWLPVFPEIQSIPVPERVPDSWSREEMEQIVKACSKFRDKIGEVNEGLWWETLVRVIYDTAERIGAVLSLRWEDIQQDGWITIRAESRKRKTRDRRYKLRPATLANLERLRESRLAGNKVVFVWPYSYGRIWLRFKDVLEVAKLPTGRRHKFHKIRRTTASEFEAAGGNATELLDHQNRRTTLRYLDPRVLKSVQPADIIPGIGEKISKAVSSGDDSEVIEAIKELLKQQRKAK